MATNTLLMKFSVIVSFAKNSHEASQLQDADKSKTKNNASETLLKEEIKRLEMNLSKAEKENRRLKHSYDKVINDSEDSHKQLKRKMLCRSFHNI